MFCEGKKSNSQYVISGYCISGICINIEFILVRNLKEGTYWKT
jgi:hypothetical protein